MLKREILLYILNSTSCYRLFDLSIAWTQITWSCSTAVCYKTLGCTLVLTPTLTTLILWKKGCPVYHLSYDGTLFFIKQNLCDPTLWCIIPPKWYLMVFAWSFPQRRDDNDGFNICAPPLSLEEALCATWLGAAIIYYPPIWARSIQLSMGNYFNCPLKYRTDFSRCNSNKCFLNLR